MKNRDKAIVLVIAFVAVIAIVGTVTFNRYETRKEAELAKVEKSEEKPEMEEETQVANTDEVEAEIEEEVEEEVEEKPQQKPEAKPESLSFSAEDTLIWPVDGNVILNYSMDQTVYFATLDQYKYNPALVISGETGEPVLAAADGKVTAIGSDARLGNTLTVDLGDGYQTIYGQLQEIRVEEGQKLNQGDVIGYIEDPTKYYTVEGPNLYFQLLKDGKPENPLEYMEE